MAKEKTEESVEQKTEERLPRTIKNIVADLSKPVSASHLKQRKQGGVILDYISWADATRYLDHYTDSRWNYEITHREVVGDKYVMSVRLTIYAEDGEFYKEAVGEENINVKFGDPFTNCESQALRRAASKFGLCRYLYK